MKNLQQRINALDRRTIGGGVLLFTIINNEDERDAVMENHNRQVEKFKKDGQDVLSYIIEFSPSV